MIDLLFHNNETEIGADSTRFATACPERNRRNHWNLPLKVTLPDGGSARFRYTADGQRYLKEASGEETFYILDGPQTLAVMKDNTLRWWNITGQGIEGRWETASDSLRFYVTDHLGSTRAVVDNDSNVLESFDYYPFGLLMPKRNTATLSIILNLHQQTSHYPILTTHYSEATKPVQTHLLHENSKAVPKPAASLFPA